MSSGERPIGTAKGKQTDTEALCQPPPPPEQGRRVEQKLVSLVVREPTGRRCFGRQNTAKRERGR